MMPINSEDFLADSNQWDAFLTDRQQAIDKALALKHYEALQALIQNDKKNLAFLKEQLCQLKVSAKKINQVKAYV